MSIGEQLEEARKRLGISIRDAAEATKIRGEYLAGMENDEFDIPLPDIYVRGFLKNYAKHLKLDPDTLMTDFNAQRLAAGKQAKREKGEVLGRMDLPERKFETPAPSSPAARSPEPEKEPEPEEKNKTPGSAMAELSAGQPPYGKIFAAAAGLVILALLIWGAAGLFRSNSAPELNPQLSSAGQEEKAGDALKEEKIILEALGPVTVIVEQVRDKKRLFDRIMEKGERVPLQKKGPVIISFSEGNNLVLIANGRRFPMNRPGMGKQQFP